MKKFLVVIAALVIGACVQNEVKNLQAMPIGARPAVTVKPKVPPVLIGGREASIAEWPASVWTRSCSATVVGPQAVLIAAHCVGQGKSIDFTVGANRYSAVCTHSSKYKENETADYAACVTDKPVTGMLYETVLQDERALRTGGELLLTGYGCTRSGGGGGNDGIFRIGEARIVQLPTGTSNDIITRGNAALCFGDSGGAAYLIAGSERFMVSVNSRGNISDTSYLSSLSSEEGKRFLRAWIAGKGQPICGVSGSMVGCRNSEPHEQGPDVELASRYISQAQGLLTQSLSVLNN